MAKDADTVSVLAKWLERDEQHRATIERLKDEKRRLLEFLRYYDMGSVELELAARDAIADIDPEE